MSNLIPFQFEEFQVRIFEKDGDPWFVAGDVCSALDVGNSRQALTRLDDEEKGVISADTPGGRQDIAVINESGLYSLILTSRKPSAKQFKKWITSEVLPSIRKTGGYGAQDPIKILNDPAAMRGLLLTYAEKVIALEERVEKQKPALAALARIEASEGSLTITETAKTLGIGPKSLFGWMHQNGWIYRGGSGGWMANQSKMKPGGTGWLEHSTHTVSKPDIPDRTFTNVHVTPRGAAELAKRILGGQPDLFTHFQ